MVCYKETHELSHEKKNWRNAWTFGEDCGDYTESEYASGFCRCGTRKDIHSKPEKSKLRRIPVNLVPER